MSEPECIVICEGRYYRVDGPANDPASYRLMNTREIYEADPDALLIESWCKNTHGISADEWAARVLGELFSEARERIALEEKSNG